MGGGEGGGGEHLCWAEKTCISPAAHGGEGSSLSTHWGHEDNPTFDWHVEQHGQTRGFYLNRGELSDHRSCTQRFLGSSWIPLLWPEASSTIATIFIVCGRQKLLPVCICKLKYQICSFNSFVPSLGCFSVVSPPTAWIWSQGPHDQKKSIVPI